MYAAWKEENCLTEYNEKGTLRGQLEGKEGRGKVVYDS